MKNQSKKLFYKMLRIRRVEECISRRYFEWKMRCPVHLSIGQEAPAVGVIENLSKKDKIVTAHRSHAHYLAKGGNLKFMIAELYGKKTGCAKGKGGSMHLIDLKAGVSAAVPIVGSTIPIGVGLSWSMKLKKQKNIVTIFFGDGATEEGVFQESLDFASLHSLPVLFVCENNQYSVYSHLRKRQSKKRNILKISKAIGVDSTKLVGDDVNKIFKVSKKIINKIKKKSQPHLILIDTFRHLEHCGPNNDDHLKYRSNKYINKWLNNDPLKKILKEKIFSDKELKNFEKKIDKEIISAFRFADKSEFPTKKVLFEDIYAK
jgi:TPP-dependent pyruvate/acetoin dehydrogenase alpha subunit